jgi:Glycosyltransferase family 87
VVLYVISGVVAAVGLGSSVAVYRQWSAMAVGPYFAAAVVAFSLHRRASSARARWWLAVATIVAVVLVPMALEIAWGPHAAPAQHVESETLITEEAAGALLHGRDPYATTYVHGPLAAWPVGTKTHYAYLPAMLLFGLPCAVSSTPAADARAAFLAVALLAWAAAWRLGRLSSEDALLLLQSLVILPTGAILLTGGGDDVAVAAVMVLAVACVRADRPGWAGVFGGLAAAMKQLAWPLLPFVVVGCVCMGRGARRVVAATASLVVAGAIVPFAVWNPGRFYEDVIRYPLGYGKAKVFHPTPTLGVLIARAFPHLRGTVGLFAGLAVAACTVWLLARRGPWSSRRIALGTATVILVAWALAPASRLGFVVYPAALFAWAVGARDEARPARTPADTVRAVAARGGERPLRRTSDTA